MLALLFVASVGAPNIHAQTVETTANAAVETQIADLMKQVALLQAQLKTLKGTNAALESEVNKLRLESKMHLGTQGEEVKTLQRLLSTDPTIYPEGLITGFFGPLTETAVKRFQAKLKIEQVGSVGPQTLARINEILSGVTGELPADLLSTRVKVEIKIVDGKEEVKIEVKCDSSGKGNVCKDEDDEEEQEDDDEEDEEDDEDEDDDEAEDEDEDDDEEDDD